MYKKKNISNKTKEIFDKVVANLQKIVEQGEYANLLKFNRNFRNYSMGNVILIYEQFPSATRVAGKAKWEKLGRTVKSDAKKIFIAAPIPRSYKTTVKEIVDGVEVEKEEIIKYNAYRWVYVYDISDTEGKEIPFETTTNLDNNDMLPFYEKLKLFSKVPVYEKEIFGGAKGYYSKKNNEIAIRNNLSINEKTAVLLHEIAHSLYDDFDYSKDRDLSEIFVESVAFIVADNFGLDNSMCSFRYILGWANGEPKKVIDLGNKIQKCANDYIEALENFEVQDQVEKLGLVA